jgi:hypothetical protein
MMLKDWLHRIQNRIVPPGVTLAIERHTAVHQDVVE